MVDAPIIARKKVGGTIFTCTGSGQNVVELNHLVGSHDVNDTY